MGIKTNADKMLKLKLVILFILIISVSFMVLNFLSDKVIKGTKGNVFYISIVNYSLPILTEGNNVGESENEVNIKSEILKAAGIDIYKPLSIMMKEIPILDIDSIKNKQAGFINPFNISDESVVKGENDEKSLDTDEPSLKKTLDPSNPEVLIYHSHTTESYAPAAADSKNNEENIVSVGNIISDELENNYGISVIHDTTLHNDMYTLSYKKSRATVEKYLKKYDSFKLIIDLHRDSGPNKNVVTAEVNGESVARIMFVMSKARSNFSQNKLLVDRLIATIDKLYPGAMTDKKIYTYNHGSYHFNQDLNDKCVLIEVGSEVNTLQEAKNSGKIIARAIAEEINGKQ